LQVDNAVDLFEIDGFGVVVQSLNSTEAAIREEAAHVIGSAVQSNPKVQIKVSFKDAVTLFPIWLSASFDFFRMLFKRTSLLHGCCA